MNIPLGIRSNNPGNIEKTPKGKKQWNGELPSSGRFAVFSDMLFGVRAAAINMISYKRRHGIKTIRAAINRHAPSFENKTAIYIRNVSEWSGYGPDEVIELDDAKTLVRILPAMWRQENGTNKGKPWVDAATIERGVQMAVKDRP